MWKTWVQLPALPDSGQGFSIPHQGFEYAFPTCSLSTIVNQLWSLSFASSFSYYETG